MTAKTCSFEGCGRKHYGNGLCQGHNQQRQRGQELRPLAAPRSTGARKEATPCAFNGCGKDARTVGLCSGHYNQRQRGQELVPLRPRRANGSTVACSFSGCVNDTTGGAHGLCRGHNRQRALGRELSPLRSANPASVRDADGRKRCFECDEWLDVSAFHAASNQPDGLQTRCVGCTRAAMLMKRYRLTPAQYDALLAAQGGGCAICGAPESPDGSSLAVDHDHACCPTETTCGLCVRGLLCRNCNQGLGNFQDDVPRILRAASYLQNSTHHM